MGLVLRFVVTVAAFAASGLFTVIVLALFVANVTNLKVIAVFVLITCPTAVIVHELGHLLAALLVGFQVSEFRAWPISVARRGSSFHLRFRFREWSPLGLVAAAPRNWRRLRVRWAVFVAGGPIANLALALLFVPGGMLLETTPKPGNDGALKSIRSTRFQAGSVIMFMSALNLALCSSNLVSMRFGGYLCDGGHLLDCVLNYPRFRRAIATLRLTADLLSGRRPRDWRSEIVDELFSFADNSALDTVARLYAYYHALDTGQTYRAAEFLRPVLAGWPAYLTTANASLALEGAYIAGFLDRDVEYARLWISRAGDGIAENQTRLRAVAALAFAEGRFDDAIHLAQEGLEAAPHSADPGGKLAEIDLLTELLNESRKQQEKSRAEPRPAGPASN